MASEDLTTSVGEKISYILYMVLQSTQNRILTVIHQVSKNVSSDLHRKDPTADSTDGIIVPSSMKTKVL